MNNFKNHCSLPLKYKLSLLAVHCNLAREKAELNILGYLCWSQAPSAPRGAPTALVFLPHVLSAEFCGPEAGGSHTPPTHSFHAWKLRWPREDSSRQGRVGTGPGTRHGLAQTLFPSLRDFGLPGTFPNSDS